MPRQYVDEEQQSMAVVTVVEYSAMVDMRER